MSRPPRRPSPAIPRISLIWLLVAQALVILPHLAHLPGWITGLWLVCATWRIQVYRMRTSYPGVLTKSLMLLAAAFFYTAFGFNVGTMFPIGFAALGGLLAIAAGKPDEEKAHF